MATKEKIKEVAKVSQVDDNFNEIVLFNDDINTFDHVIETLVASCDHSYVQAEQCSILVHYKGKCTVKTGPYSDLEPRCSKLLQAGLSAEII
ncbi:MAG: ATP-dependent Clp protease adaptor ClpS [Bacteroidota bacterium]|nr:ATP-dependent Clp protease adaptor ClpS [Bacteroidota bacterium]